MKLITSLSSEFYEDNVDDDNLCVIGGVSREVSRGIDAIVGSFFI